MQPMLTLNQRNLFNIEQLRSKQARAPCVQQRRCADGWGA